MQTGIIAGGSTRPVAVQVALKPDAVSDDDGLLRSRYRSRLDTTWTEFLIYISDTGAE